MGTNITGGDLYSLWRVSDVHLPRIADVFYDANTTLVGGRSSGGSSDTDAFRSTASGPGGTMMSSPIGAAYAEVRDEIQSMYAQIEQTILTAATGIRQASQDFVDADMVSADALAKYRADPANHDPNDPASNPPKPGDDDYPGDPILP
ncbi:MAG: hypothetical protein WCA46_16125 [Actinocatenispora sp.]